MRYAKIIKNDMINGEGVCVSFWAQGCPHHCFNCHNPETWNFNGGFEKDDQLLIEEILNSINKNGIQRNLSILGGEPLCKENIDFVLKLLAAAKCKYPDIKTYLWTGYTIEQLDKKILKDIDILIDGPFVNEQRDITLKLRGSKNQRVLYKNIDY